MKQTLLVLMVILVAPGLAEATGSDLLTSTERAWLDRHPNIVLGVGQDWGPSVIKRGNGEVTGFAADHLALLGRKLGIRLRLEAGPWSRVVAKAEAGELAGLTLSSPLPERKAHFLFTNPFYTSYVFLYLRTGDRLDAAELSALKGKRVGYLKGILRLKNYLASEPGITAVPLDSEKALANGLLDGSLDTVVGAYTLEYWRVSHGVFGFAPTKMMRDAPPQLVISVRKDWPELVDILNKGLAAITTEEMIDLYRRWYGSNYQDLLELAGIPFNADEVDWLRTHRVLRAGISEHSAPIEFLDEKGVPQGISVAYLKRLETLLGIRFELVPVANRQQALQRLEAGTLDVLPAATMSPGRQTRIPFTEPYLTFPAAIFSAADIAYLDGLNALQGKTVAVIQDEVPQDWLQADWSDLELVKVADTQEAVQNMVRGRVFAFVGNLISTSYYIGQSGQTQVKVVGDTPYSFQLGMAVRPDWPILSGILQKGLTGISKREQDTLYHDWISIQYKRQVDYSLLWQVSIAAALILAVILYWNRRLAREVSRRRRAEAGLRVAKDTADRANRTKSNFLANVSHDLRTPLNAILGFAQLLESDRVLDGKHRAQVVGIRQGGERLRGLIDELLDLAKIEAGGFEVVPQEWNREDLLRELDGEFRLRAEDKGLALTIEPAPALPLRLSCDTKRLHQILSNLLDNAIKYTRSGAVSLHMDFEDGMLDLAVTDTGIGISPEQVQMIFEPFRQLGERGKAQGTGLGLAITRQLVQRMGGTITVESTLGQGSVFRVRIPAKVAAGPVVPAKPSSGVDDITGYRRTEGQGTLNILVADDEPENRAILRRMLEPLGFRVTEAEDGGACIELAKSEPPDLILMDLRMPEKDGLEATRALRAHPTLGKIPVVAVTAAAFEQDRSEALAAGCDAHLAKPVLHATLLDVVGALLPLAWVRGVPSRRADEPPPNLNVLGEERRARLIQLVRTGNVTGISGLAEELDADGCCPDLARRIGALADDFDLAGLRRLVEGDGMHG